MGLKRQKVLMGWARWEMPPMAKRVKHSCVVRTVGRISGGLLPEGLTAERGVWRPQGSHGTALHRVDGGKPLLSEHQVSRWRLCSLLPPSEAQPRLTYKRNSIRGPGERSGV